MAPSKKSDAKRKLEAVAQQITLINNCSTAAALLEFDEAAVEVRIEQVDRLQKKFDAIQSQLEEEDADDIMATFTNHYIEVKTKLTRQLYACRGTEAHRSMMRPSSGEQPSFIVAQPKQRLPVLQIPKFSGNYADWPDFFSMFSTVVHQDVDLTRIEKFQHLRSSLREAALDTIRSLEMSDQNYDKALELLKARFDNKRLNFQAHIRDIVQLKRVEGERVAKLRELSDNLNAHLRALQTMGTKEQIADCLLIQLVAQKLDVKSRAKWEEQAPASEIPTWNSMAKFLEQRCQRLENVENALAPWSPEKQVGNKLSQNSNNRKVLLTSAVAGCILCGSSEHRIAKCEQFLGLSALMRYKEAKRLLLCLNCLRGGHSLKDCKSGHCRHCTSKHHSLLHQETNLFTNTPSASASAQQPSPAQTTTTLPTRVNPYLPFPSPSFGTPSSALVSSEVQASVAGRDFVLLATSVIFVKNRYGSLIPCRALLDSASQLNFITNRLVNQLQLKKIKTSQYISGIGQNDFVANHVVDLDLHSRINDYAAKLSAVVTSTITDVQPSRSLKGVDWNIPSNIRLADPLFFEPQRIDMLIGACLFFDLLCVGQIRLAENLPILQKTKLGWVVSGATTYNASKLSCLAAIDTAPTNASDFELNNLVERFWEIENCNVTAPKTTTDEDLCEEHFIKNYKRLQSGEFSVRLPMQSPSYELGESYQQAINRFKSLERKLQRNTELKRQYSSFIKEYLELNHMSVVDAFPKQTAIHFLPHHCVLKADSTTTKLRVVFDGSAPTSNGRSLNSILMKGPTIQRPLFDILLTFRTFKFALTADICKMYRCVKMSYPDSFLQCIIWRDNPNEDFRIFKLDTVTYGTKPASFLAIRSMQQLARDEARVYPVGAETIYNGFYVDDMIFGTDSVDEAKAIINQTRKLLSLGNFHLRKWCSNDENVLSDVAADDRREFLTFDDGTSITKTLGLVWDPRLDIFMFTFSPFATPTNVTKRTILSAIARLYDPLGLIGPVVVKAKIFLQNLWNEKLHWDESPSQSIQSEWLEICNQYKLVTRFGFDRYLLMPEADLQIHGFCDASVAAYGACIYIRAERNGHILTNLLCSKSRVAPLKTLTIPKLELSGALLLAELVAKIVSSMHFKGKVVCWSDSTIVLSWLRNEPANFNVFVANRINAIQTLTKGMSWSYVPTVSNPADVLSRGASPKELLNMPLWKYGPSYLGNDQHNWPTSPLLPIKDLPESRKRAFVFVTTSDISLNCKFLNSFDRLQRVYAYIYRFSRPARMRGAGLLNTKELQEGTILLIRMIQRSRLRDEYKALEAKKPIKATSDLRSLNPFIDNNGLIRVGGRLQNSNLDFAAKHPIILPKRHPLTDSIISSFHWKLLHAGPQSMMASIRLQYWPIGGRKTVSRVINKCVRCFHVKPKLMEHLMGNLPSERVNCNRAFLTSGVDFCGPFFYKSDVRNRPPIKCYICIFICFSTKAVHMELVKDLATSSFLAALKRFICTRGKPRTIWSDNATNFVGAKNELLDLRNLFLSQRHIKSVHEQCTSDGIEWKLIPPRSPHFGGLWEAAVKQAKYHFYRIVGLSTLNFEELRTLVCQIAAIINSRPLCPISENPDDLDVLSPGHFLIGASFTSVIEPDISALHINHLSRWQRVCYMQQQFWKKWHAEYLTLLQQRQKWHSSSHNLKPGDVVLIKDENNPPLKWPLARVIDTIHGKDDVVRVAVVKTANGIYKRAVSKLCLLPIDDNILKA